MTTTEKAGMKKTKKKIAKNDGTRAPGIDTAGTNAAKTNSTSGQSGGASQ